MCQVEFHSLYHVLNYFEVNCESRNPKSKKQNKNLAGRISAPNNHLALLFNIQTGNAGKAVTVLRLSALCAVILVLPVNHLSWSRLDLFYLMRVLYEMIEGGCH